MGTPIILSQLDQLYINCTPMGQKSVHIREVSLLQGHAMTVLEEKRSHFLKNGAAAPNVLYRFRPHSFYTFREYINLDVGGESVRSQWFPERDRLLRQTILSPLGGGWSLGGVNRTVGKFQEKRTCSFCPREFRTKFNFAHIQIHTMVIITMNVLFPVRILRYFCSPGCSIILSRYLQ